uniref:Thrombospondin type laminin G domain and EAR repeats n=1 Tax=Cyclopterus lumpus TaxID=8103 RepID=A0A8C2ZLX7_CYCLU
MPLDLLARVLPRSGEAPPPQMVQSKGSRGLRLVGAVTTALSFPASQIFSNCDYFPAEFSLVATIKTPTHKPPEDVSLCCCVSEAEARVTLGNPPPCSGPEQGQLWFNAQRKGLFVCDGLTWRTLLQNQERLDYVEDYQDLYTSSETFDVEIFSIPSEGLFMAAANRDSRPGSGIYQWRNGSFQLHQNISTQEARAWKHFTIGEYLATNDSIPPHQIFLVVANSREAEPELSVIYRWNQRRRRFLRHQTLETYTLSTSGAYDWEFFSVGPYHFLVVANTFDGQTTTISSTVYVWLNGGFQTFQSIPTVGATDWETFQIDGRFFLAVANSQKVSKHGPNLYSINSTVYELNRLTQTFIRFQDILTHSAVDWEFFTIGEEKFLVVANSHDGSSYSLNSVVYRWQGYEGFVPVHSLPTFGCRDWEHFSTDEGSFLVYSSATSRLSKVFKLRTY